MMNMEELIMTDRLIDIYKIAEIDCYQDELQEIIKATIEEIYLDGNPKIFKLRLPHIDRAIYKFKIAKEKTHIHNTKQYFKSCVLSAITETVLDELY
jgi:hypothetical protein